MVNRSQNRECVTEAILMKMSADANKSMKNYSGAKR